VASNLKGRTVVVEIPLVGEIRAVVKFDDGPYLTIIPVSGQSLTSTTTVERRQILRVE